MSNVHEGHRERVKEEFRQNGLDHFPQHKILEFLLFYAIRRGDTNELGHLLIDRFGSLSGVLDKPREVLQEVKGVGEETATFLNLISAVARAYLEDYASTNNMITGPESAKEYMRHKFLGESAECLYFAGLGSNGKVIFCKRMIEGSPETVGITPSVIVRAALRADAVKAVLAHNHPQGICNPSSADVKATSILSSELARVGVELIDHIIVAADGVCSMKEQGMLTKRTYGINP